MNNKIGFWRVNEKYGKFSNWYECSFIYDGIKFCSSEQALMYMKAVTFKDEAVAKEILATTDQKTIKALGRKVHNYNDKTWEAFRYTIMVDILKAKFSQDEQCHDLLLSTGDAEIFETSPMDKIWGIGSRSVDNVRGRNLLGKALMEVRKYLKESEV